MKSSRLKSLRAFGAVAALLTTALTAQAEAPKSGYVKVNGLKYYYEISGKGEPLLLLHGGLGSIDMFRPIIPAFTEHRQLIAIDLQGHGRTELGIRKFGLPDLGDDMAAVLTQLGYKNVDIMGYSFGGGVAFRFAVQHRDMIRRLAFASAGFAADGFYPEMQEQQKQLRQSCRLV